MSRPQPKARSVALTTSETVGGNHDASENIDSALKEEEAIVSNTDIDASTLVGSEEDKPEGSTSTKINSTERTSAGHAESPSIVSEAKRSVDANSQPAWVAGPTSRASNTPTSQADEMTPASKPDNILDVTRDSSSRLIKLQEYAVYSVELLQKHGAEIDRLFEAVDRIEDAQDDLRASVKDSRMRLQRLERKSARASTPEANVNSEEIELLTNSISRISNKVNEIDTLKLALNLFKTRIKRLESGRAKYDQFTSPERSLSPGVVSQVPSRQNELSIPQAKLKRKREKITANADEEQEYASMIEDMRKPPSRNEDRNPSLESTKRHSSQGSESPPGAPNNISTDRASSLPVKYVQPRLQPRSSSSSQKRARPTNVSKRPGSLSQSMYQSESDAPHLGIEEEDTWDPLAEVEDVADYMPVRTAPVKSQRMSSSDLRDLRLKNMANKLQKAKSSPTDGSAGKRRSSEERKREEDLASRSRSGGLGYQQESFDPDTGVKSRRVRLSGLGPDFDDRVSSSSTSRAAENASESERSKRDDRDREASVAMRMDGLEDL